VPKAELGIKRICAACHKPFYDLRKNPAHCPECGHTFNPEEILRGKRLKPANEPPVKPEPEKVVEPAEAELPEVEEGDEADEELIEDTSDLGADEDVADVVAPGDEGGREER
jgi:uncharacterized protein (TIGR02300 family)